MCEGPFAPVLHLADCSGLARCDGVERVAVRGSEENYCYTLVFIERCYKFRAAINVGVANSPRMGGAICDMRRCRRQI